MIIPLADIRVDTFDKHVLTSLKPYFDIDFESTQKEQWYRNLLTLAKHNLAVAHCLFHHWGAKLHVAHAFRDKAFPKFYLPGFDQQIGCYSNAKTSDNIMLEFVNEIPRVIGQKHWISNVHQAEFGVFSVSFQDHQAIILYDFTKNLHKIQTNVMQIGMELAQAGSIIMDQHTVPKEYILGYYNKAEANHIFSPVSNLMSYAFITNYLGAIVSLYRDLEEYVKFNNINIDFELKSLGVEVSMLKMLWDNDLHTIYETNFTDKFWHKRNTQYTQSKKILLSLINLILSVGNPRWLDKNSIDAGQRFRDALVFSAHMNTFYNNLHGQHFVMF